MQSQMGRIDLNALVGFAVGLAGGLIGLGGAELRLPYLAGTLKLPLKTAVPINLAVSLPTRLLTLKVDPLKPFAYDTLAVAIGAVVAAYFGVSWLRRVSSPALTRAVFVLLMVLGLSMVVEAVFSLSPVGFVPDVSAARLVIALMFGLVIGAVMQAFSRSRGRVTSRKAWIG